MAKNQLVSGSLVFSNTVPAVSRSCFLHRLHWKTLRVLRAQKPRLPQLGQTSPSRQPIPPAQLEQRLAASVLISKLLAERGFAQSPHRTPQPAHACHHNPPTAAKPACSLAPTRMPVVDN